MADSVLGFSVNFYTDRTADELKAKGWDDAGIALAESLLAERGLWIGMKAGVEKPKAVEADKVADPLPESFPYKKELEAGGVFSLTQLDAMPDEALLTIKDIGPKRLEEIRAAQISTHQTE